MKYLIALLSFFVCAGALARPITFRDGSRVAFETHPVIQDLDLAYSVSARAALGFEAIWHSSPQSPKETAIVARWDQLWWRANDEDFQASVYTLIGLGYLYSGSGEHNETLHFRYGLSGDAENRRFYSAASFAQGVSPRLTPSNELRFRLGFAPYLAEFDQLQSWVLLQYDVDTIHEDRTSWIGPVLRFSFKSFLWEIGSLTQPGQWQDRSYFLAFETVF